MAGQGGPPYAGFYKIAYVTRDLAGAAKPFFATFGSSVFHSGEPEEVDLGGGASARVRRAKAWFGALLVELIEPLEDAGGYYAALLPPLGRLAGLHHLGRLFDSAAGLEAGAERYRKAGHGVIQLGNGLFRADLRESIGHHIEGFVPTAAERQMLASLPQGVDDAGMAILDGGITPYPGYYQFTYMTNDFARAIAYFKQVHGIDRFMETPYIPLELIDGAEGHCDVALVHLGAMEMELMHPVDGAVGIYTDFLPGDAFQIRHHHISRCFATYPAFERRKAECEALGLPVLCDNYAPRTDTSRFYYIDAREGLGHYLESAVFDEVGKAFITPVPRQ